LTQSEKNDILFKSVEKRLNKDKFLFMVSVSQKKTERHGGVRLFGIVMMGLLMAGPFSFLGVTGVVQAAYDPGYAGTVDKKAVTVEVKKGEQATVILTYTNTGKNTWYKTGVKDFVALSLVGKTSSPIGGAAWRSPDQPALIADNGVKPGKKTTVKFVVYGKEVGTYSETLRLSAENVAWMRTAETALTVKVVAGSTASAPTAPAQIAPGAPVTSGMAATLLLRSAKDLTLKGSERVQFTLGFKNSGTTRWLSRSLVLAGMVPATNGDVNASIYDSTWKSPAEPVHVDTVTNPGEIGFLDFWLKAPARKGNYRVSLSLQADGQAVDGGIIDIPITVTADGEILNTPPPVIPTTPGTPPSSLVVGSDGIAQSPKFQATEPIIRVGIFTTTDDQMIITAPGPFRVQQKGNAICAFTSGQQVTVRFDRANKVYKATGPGCTTQSSEYYQIQRTDDPLAPLTMADFTRPVSWLPGANDNTFRSILELRWSPKTDAVWAINELPIEMYLRGIAETSDVSPMEYQKALLTGARTYAMYHWVRGTKHAAEYFHVDAKYDQVYRGYGAEARSPKIVQAITETRGQIVTYNQELAITPYYSRSDGRTRNWNEVWGGSGFPWLVSVPVPQDIGRTLWGHGVGLSASGALGMAKEGSLYRDILKHFYQGTDVMKYY
jgi:hypothetical protein